MNRRGFLSAIGALVGGLAMDHAIPLGRVWSFPSKIVIPPPRIGPHLFLSKDGRVFTPMGGLSAVDYRPSRVVEFADVMNLDSAGSFREWLPLLRDSITFSGPGIGGLIAGSSLGEFNSFRVELSDGIVYGGGIIIDEVEQGERDYRITGSVTPDLAEELIHGSTDSTVIARESQFRELARRNGYRSPVKLAPTQSPDRNDRGIMALA